MEGHPHIFEEFDSENNDIWKDKCDQIFQESVTKKEDNQELLIFFKESINDKTKSKQEQNNIQENIVLCSINERFFCIVEIMLKIMYKINNIRCNECVLIHMLFRPHPNDDIYEHEMQVRGEQIQQINKDLEDNKTEVQQLFQELEELIILEIDHNYNNIPILLDGVVFNNNVNVDIILPICIDNIGKIQNDLNNSINNRDAFYEIVDKTNINRDIVKQLNDMKKYIDLGYANNLYFCFMRMMLEMVVIISYIHYKHLECVNIKSSPMICSDLDIGNENGLRENQCLIILGEIENAKFNLNTICQNFKAKLRQ